MSDEEHRESQGQEQSQQSDVKLFVGNITYKTTDNDLRDLFEKYGEVKEARVAVDNNTGRARGFGFITMTNKDHAEEAMNNINKTQLDGREIRVEISSGERRAPREGGRRDFGDRRREFGDRRRDDRGRDRSRSRDRRDARSRSRDRRDFGRGDRAGDRRGDGGYDRRGGDRGDRDNYRNREGGRRDSR